MIFSKLKLYYTYAVLGTSLLLFNVGIIGQQLCVDFLLSDVCQSYVRWNKCNRYGAILACRRTCGACSPGWSTWSMYGACSSSCMGTQTRSRTCRGMPSDCPGLSIQTQPCNTICTAVVFSSAPGGGGTATIVITASTTPTNTNLFIQSIPQLLPTGISRGATVGPGGIDISSILCNGTHFKCATLFTSNKVCVPLTLVCDGFDDCPFSSDENPSNCFASANSANAFQIKNELRQVCLEVITNDPQGPINGVRAYRQCPTMYNPQWSKFAWRWWKSFHLLNVYTGRCLEAQNPNLAFTPELTSNICDDANLNQKFICEDQLKIRLKFEPLNSPNFYLSLGDSNIGWPVVLQDDSPNLNRLWQLGIIGVTQSVCTNQVYWSDWSSWSACSRTCNGGQRNHTRTCINGPVGVAPCLGNIFEIGPCNSLVSCATSTTNTNQNSQCFSGFGQINNAYSSLSSIPLDPTCYFVNPSSLSFEEAKKNCENQGGFLAMIKENSARILSSVLVSSVNSSARAYIGVKENPFLPSVQGHSLRFSFDDSPVGHEKPWFTDCVLGPGYDYIGNMDVTISGFRCQNWNSNFPHEVNFKPLGDSDHNYCRNPNFDPNGPWCYTVSSMLVRDYCLIPQCLDTSPVSQMGENAEFRLALSCDNVLSDDSLYSFVFSVSDQLLLQPCAPKKIENWQNVPASEKFVWDSSQSRIINLANLYCLEASNTQLPNFEAVLRPCISNTVTQSWSAVNNRIKLTYSTSHSNFQLDASSTGRTLVVNAREQNAWTAARSGYFDDMALLQDAGRSFHIYSITDGLCLGTTEDPDYAGQLVATISKDERTLGLFPCQQSPTLRWIRYLSTSQAFFNVYSGLCLIPASHTPGSSVKLLRCDRSTNVVQWSCNSNMEVLFVSSNQLYLTVVNKNIVISAYSSQTTKWSVGERNSQPICSSPVPEGNVPAGGSFVLRNGFRQDLCIQADEFGSVFSQKCTEFGTTPSSSMVWSFTDSPAMLIQLHVRRCLSVVSARSGASLMTSLCNVRDSRQQWLLSRQQISSQHPDINSPFYNIHLAINKELVVSIDPTTGRVLLRTANVGNFVAFNRFSHLTSVQTMSDCYLSQDSIVRYSGFVSTTRTGKRCVPWTDSEKIQYPELEANYCRSPGNSTSVPWCFTSSSGNKMPEDCIVPECVSHKVVVDASGLWYPVDGTESYPSICQAEPECYRDNGGSYMGRFNTTLSGPCLPWTSTPISSPVLPENYCRNPTDDQGGPYCYVSATTRTTCSTLPQCKRVCLTISPDIANAMVARLLYSGSGYGVETGSTSVIQCLPGYWINSVTNRINANCAVGDWSPLSAGCTRMECSTVPPTAPQANLTVLGRFFGDITALTCFPGMLAGPMLPVLKYACNSNGDWVRIGDPNAQCSSPCDNGLVAFRSYCYGVSVSTASFADALQASIDIGGSLADLDDETDFNFLRDLVISHANLDYGSDSLYWLGIRHFSLTPRSNDPLWRDWRSVNALNDAEVMEMKGVKYLPFIRNTFRIRHFLHGRYIANPDHVIPYDSRCLYVDEKLSFVGARSCFDYPEETMLWAWISPFHLYHVASGKCLTGFAADSYSPVDLHFQATATACDLLNQQQYVGCRRYSSHASLKLLLHENSFFVDTLQDSWDRIQMGGGAYAGNFSHWIINETNLDVCHHSVTYKGKAYLLWEGSTASGTSYTYDQAVERCARDGATIASENAVSESLANEEASSCACAWVDGAISVSVMRIGDPLCPISLPIGGVVHCPGSVTVADVWCYKGTNVDPPYAPWAVALFLDSPDRFGVMQKNSLDRLRFIVRKESRWRCPNPPPADRARLLESPSTSYSYLGTTAYQCDPGYWYGVGVFSQVIFCSANLQWEPTPGTFACIGLYCPTPVDIPFADKTVDSVSYRGTATYQCREGMWFGNFRFKVEIQCSETGGWLPPLSSLFCSVLTCDNPPPVRYASFNFVSLNYQSVASYVCDPGYWFRPRVFKLDVTCGADAMWTPSPKDFICWEVVCPPLADNSSNIWNPKSRKLLDLSCEKGFILSGSDVSFGTFRVPGDKIEFECSDQGLWLPNPSLFYCARARCSRPPDVPSAEHTAYHLSVEFDYGSNLSYFCIPGSSNFYMFALYSKTYELCIYEGNDGLVYATKAACSTSDMTFLRWGDSASADGFLPLINAETDLCLTATSISNQAGRVDGVRFIPCNNQNSLQYWFCNQYGVSDLILGVRTTRQLYLSIHLDTDVVYATTDPLKAVDFMSFHDRTSDVDYDVCRYQRPRPEQHVTCLADGTWLPDPNFIRCIFIFCTPPPTLPFATMQLDTIDGSYGSYVTYTCDDGYAYVGGSVQLVVRCSDGGNWVPDPHVFSCMRALCPRYVIPSGSTITAGDIDNHEFGSLLMIACPLGYIFRDNITSLTVRCLANGQWEESELVDNCLPISCGRPATVRHATVTATGSFRYNTVARYVCDSGYRFDVGRTWSDVYCNAEGLWEPDPSSLLCSVVDCPRPVEIENAAMYVQGRTQNGLHVYGAVAFYRCRNGLEFFDGIVKRTVTCRDDGRWHPDPLTLFCSLMTCPSLHDIMPRYGYVIGSDHSFGGEIEFHCQAGYVVEQEDLSVAESVTVTCHAFRRWLPDPLKLLCIRRICSSLPNVAFTQLTMDTGLFGQQVQYTCLPGYHLRPGVGDYITTCSSNGTWVPNPLSFSCQPINCGHPGVYEHARPVILINSTTRFGMFATVECNDGFWFDGIFQTRTTIQCSVLGLWSPPPEDFRCVYVLCSDPGKVKFASRSILLPDVEENVTVVDPITQGLFFKFGVRLNYSCGLTRAVVRAQRYLIVTCTGDGTWDVDLETVTCSRITCPSPFSIAFAFVTLNSAFTYDQYYVGSTLQYSCFEGYWFYKDVYSKRAVCQNNGMWNITPTDNCIRVSCPPPPAMANGRFLFSIGSIPLAGRYHCNSGFLIRNNPVLLCSVLGQWVPDPTTLSCDPLPCPRPPSVSNAMPDSLPPAFTYQTRVTFRCLAGFRFRSGLDLSDIVCEGDGSWSGTDIACVSSNNIECLFPPFAPNSYYVSRAPRTIALTCHPGFIISTPQGVLSATQLRFCGDDGLWTPPAATCQETYCSTPIIPTGSTITSPVPLLPAHTFKIGGKINITCDRGSAFPFSPISRTFTSTITFTCQLSSEWFPHIPSFSCQVVLCPVPPNVERATLRYSRIDYGSVAIYRCLPPGTFEGVMFRLITCTVEGQWQPDPYGFQCLVQRCKIPEPPPFSILSLQSTDLNLDPYNSQQRLRVTCGAGHTIKGIFYNMMSQVFDCGVTGDWLPYNPAYVNCSAVECLPPGGAVPPNFQISSAQPQDSYPYGSTLTFSCSGGLWLSPGSLLFIVSRCLRNGTWEPRPEKFRCYVVTCSYPPILPFATLRLYAPVSMTSNGLEYGSVWRYSCLNGFRVPSGKTFSDIECLRFGRWFPAVDENLCRPPPCSIPPYLPRVKNTYLVVLGDLDPSRYPDELRFGNNFTYECLDGYWMSDGFVKKKKSMVTCFGGEWLPDPRSLPSCVPVVCDSVPTVFGARSDGIARAYGSRVAYTCAAGQHFRQFKLRRVYSSCNGSGLWDPEPNSLACTDVYCDDFDIPGAIKFGSSLKGGASLIFSCFVGTRFSPETTQLATTCNDDGVWDPDISTIRCEEITCGVPHVKNALLLRPTYETGITIQLQCLGGFFFLPIRSNPPLLTCDSTGRWSPDPRMYKCQGRLCPRPDQIDNGELISMGEDRVGDSVRILCDPGYFVFPGTVDVNATCMPDTLWSKNISNVKCSPIVCPPLPDVAGATSQLLSSIPPPHYLSLVQYVCDGGLAFEGGTLVKVVGCEDRGLWSPPINFKCRILRCPAPFPKRNSVIEGRFLASGDYPTGHKFTYRCTNFSWLSAEYAVAEWAFVGVFDVKVACMVSGNWTPNLDSFACRPIHEGPLPTGYSRGLTFEQVESENWLDDDEYFARDFENQPYVTAVETGERKWLRGSDLPTSLVRAGGPAVSDARFAWDGDLRTSWDPVFNSRRRYNVTIYLGEQLQIVEAVTVFSGASEFERVHHLIVMFSPHGKRFNYTASTALISRQLTEEEEEEEFDFSSRLTVSGFSFPAKFLQIIVLQSSGLDIPPIIYEIRVLATPARWYLQYPYDPFPFIFLLAWLACFLFALCYSRKQDILDRWRVQFAPTSFAANKFSKTPCYIIHITLVNTKNFKYLFFRAIHPSTDSTIFLINSELDCKQYLIYLPTNFSHPPVLQLAFLDQQLEKASNDPSMLVLVKIGHMEISDSIKERVSWIHMSKLVLYSGKADFVVFNEKSQQKLTDVLSGTKPEETYYWKIREALLDHLVLNIFTKNVVSQLTRIDHLFISTIGFFSTIMLSLFLSMTFTIGCIPLVFICPMIGCFVVIIMKIWLLAQPLYGLKKPPAVDDEDAHPLLKLMSVAQSFDDRSLSKGETKHDGVRALNLLEELVSTEKQKAWTKKPTLTEKEAEIFHSSLLPERYRYPSNVGKLDGDSVTSLDFEAAFRKRWGSTRRRTRSASSILVPKRNDVALLLTQSPPHSITTGSKTDKDSNLLHSGGSRSEALSKTVSETEDETLKTQAATTTEDATSSTKPVEDSVSAPLSLSVQSSAPARKRRLSCASLWTEESLAEEWHRVHTSLNETAFFQKGPLRKKKKLDDFKWLDPTYRRIPSKHLLHGNRFLKPVNLDTIGTKTPDHSSSFTSWTQQSEKVDSTPINTEVSSFDSHPVATDQSSQGNKSSYHSILPSSNLQSPSSVQSPAGYSQNEDERNLAPVHETFEPESREAENELLRSQNAPQYSNLETEPVASYKNLTDPPATFQALNASDLHQQSPAGHSPNEDETNIAPVHETFEPESREAENELLRSQNAPQYSNLETEPVANYKNLTDPPATFQALNASDLHQQSPAGHSQNQDDTNIAPVYETFLDENELLRSQNAPQYSNLETEPVASYKNLTDPPETFQTWNVSYLHQQSPAGYSQNEDGTNISPVYETFLDENELYCWQNAPQYSNLDTEPVASYKNLTDPPATFQASSASDLHQQPPAGHSQNEDETNLAPIYETCEDEYELYCGQNAPQYSNLETESVASYKNLTDLPATFQTRNASDSHQQSPAGHSQNEDDTNITPVYETFLDENELYCWQNAPQYSNLETEPVASYKNLTDPRATFQTSSASDLHQGSLPVDVQHDSQSSIESFHSASLEIKDNHFIDWRLRIGRLTRTQSLTDQSRNSDFLPQFFSLPNISRGTRLISREHSLDLSRDCLQPDTSEKFSGVGQLSVDDEGTTWEARIATSSSVSCNSLSIRRKKKPLRRKDRLRSSMPAPSTSASSHLEEEEVAIDSSSLDGVSLLEHAQCVDRSSSFSTLLDETRSEETLKHVGSCEEKSWSDVTTALRQRFMDDLVLSDSTASNQVYCIAPSAGYYTSDYIDDYEFKDAVECQEESSEMRGTDVCICMEDEEDEDARSHWKDDSLSSLIENDQDLSKSDSSRGFELKDSVEQSHNDKLASGDSKSQEEKLVVVSEFPLAAVHSSSFAGDDEHETPDEQKQVTELYKQTPDGAGNPTHVVSAQPAAFFYQVPLARRKKSIIMLLIIICFASLVVHLGLRGIDQREETICLFAYTTVVYFALLYVEAWFRQEILSVFNREEELSFPLLYPKEAGLNL